MWGRWKKVPEALGIGFMGEPGFRAGGLRGPGFRATVRALAQEGNWKRVQGKVEGGRRPRGGSTEPLLGDSWRMSAEVAVRVGDGTAWLYRMTGCPLKACFVPSEAKSSELSRKIPLN